MKKREADGLPFRVRKYPPLQFEKIVASPATPLSTIARQAGMDVSELKQLNPQLKLDRTRNDAAPRSGSRPEAEAVREEKNAARDTGVPLGAPAQLPERSDGLDPSKR
jgi:hypothetical protein